MTLDEPDPIYTPKRVLKVICAGAGPSGIFLAYKIQRHFDAFDLTLYEKNPDIGGTWLVNRYPGCECDVPAHIYSYTFEPKRDWNSVFAGSVEITNYFHDFADKYNLRKYVKLEHSIKTATWNDKNSIWDVTVEANGKIFSDWCHVFVNCAGTLNKWIIPEFEGLGDFKGPMCHSANWDPTIDLDGKTVAVVGNGPTGIQLIPAILPRVGKLVSFFRKPIWTGVDFYKQRAYSEAEKEMFQEDEQYLKFRRAQEILYNQVVPLYMQSKQKQDLVREEYVKAMTDKIQDLNLHDIAIPSGTVGCDRITPGRGYLESLANPKLQRVKGGIQKITENGIVDIHGVHHEVDVILFATGFDYNRAARFQMTGKDGRSLNNALFPSPQSYMGYAVSGFPNSFLTLGSLTPFGSASSILVKIEAQIGCMIKIMSKYQKENLKSFDVNPLAQEELMRHKDEFFDGSVCHTVPRAWYKAADGVTTNGLWPGTSLHYLETLSEIRWEDWDIEYNGNRFRFLGNGFSTIESQNLDYAPYITLTDTSPIDPVLKQSHVSK